MLSIACRGRKTTRIQGAPNRQIRNTLPSCPSSSSMRHLRLIDRNLCPVQRVIDFVVRSLAPLACIKKCAIVSLGIRLLQLRDCCQLLPLALRARLIALRRPITSGYTSPAISLRIVGKLQLERISLRMLLIGYLNARPRVCGIATIARELRVVGMQNVKAARPSCTHSPSGRPMIRSRPHLQHVWRKRKGNLAWP